MPGLTDYTSVTSLNLRGIIRAGLSDGGYLIEPVVQPWTPTTMSEAPTENIKTYDWTIEKELNWAAKNTEEKESSSKSALETITEKAKLDFSTASGTERTLWDTAFRGGLEAVREKYQSHLTTVIGSLRDLDVPVTVLPVIDVPLERDITLVGRPPTGENPGTAGMSDTDSADEESD